MGNFLKTQNSFSCGEVAPDFYAINNVNGVAKLENMDVIQSGGLKRRAGLKRIKSAPDDAILVPFQISESEKYLLVIYQESIDVYSNDTKITTLVAPWDDSDLNKLQYVQRFNQLFFVHPSYRPRILTKTASGFNISQFNFETNSDASINIPFMQFDDIKNISITITSSDIDNNHATFTTDADLWDSSWVGERLFVDDKQWIVTSVTSARIATVYTNADFSFPESPIYDWYVAAFSNKRGWPVSIAFHQNRLIFGGTTSAPNNIWMSKVGNYYSFDAGSGLDDDAIYVTLLASTHHQICNIVSSDTLQILTSVGEWAISNTPLTPANVDIKQHTSVGSICDKYLPPQKIEGSTVFISESGKDIRELDLDTLSQSYNAVDLCTYSKHLMKNPISIAYNQFRHQLYVVMNDGTMAVLNKYSNTEINAWSVYKTDGQFKYVAVMNDNTYVLVQRKNTNYLERLDDSTLNDSESFGFSYKISALPMIVNGHGIKKIRVRKITVRVRDTKTIFVNEYRMEIPNEAFETNGYNGDLSINLFGTECDTMNPVWTVSSSEQLPTTILSVTTDGFYVV